jgi:hypothetical protein
VGLDFGPVILGGGEISPNFNLKYDFNGYKGFSMEFFFLNGPNSPDFKKKKFQVHQTFYKYVPVSSQEYRRILFSFFYFHIWSVAKSG